MNYIAGQDRSLNARELDTERLRVAVAERDQMQNERNFYEAKADSLTKQRGFGCVMKKAFTLGSGRCG